jgi:CBS domain-containing protein
LGIVQTLKKVFPQVLSETVKKQMRSLRVQDVMSYPVKTITEDATMADAAIHMGRHHIGSLIVTENDEHVGIITERDLMSKVLAFGKKPAEVKVGRVMSKPLVTVNHDASLKEASKRMIQRKSRLGVKKGMTLVGIVTASDLIKGLPEAPETEVEPLKFGSKVVETVDKRVTVDKVVRVMGEKRIGSVVVMSEGKPMGIFTERDLLTTLMSKGEDLSVQVGEVASVPLMVTDRDVNVFEAADIMKTHKIKRLPIVDEKDEFKGIVTARDLVEAYSK